ncbi:MAG: DUF4164 family protein [Devosia sp.]
MSDTEQSMATASARLDRAFARFDSSLQDFGARLTRQQRSEAELQRLYSERARFAADLDKASARAKRLDESAGEVARRLVEAMETVRSVLVK